jgi:hypothetical protein
MARKPSDYVQIAKIRVRERVRKALAAAAEKNQRTLNAEIADRLESSLERQDNEVRDSAVVQALAGPDPVRAELLRMFAFMLANHAETADLADGVIRRMTDPADSLCPHANETPEQRQERWRAVREVIGRSYAVRGQVAEIYGSLKKGVDK